jgi:hypothetical protein
MYLGSLVSRAITNDADPTVAQLAAAYQSNGVGYNSLQGISDLHTLYGKPLLIWDTAFASFPNAAMCHGELALFELQPGNAWPAVDYQAQVNLYQAFFQVVPKLDPAWFWGIVFDSFDRLPYSWKDTHMAAFLGSPGESLRGKPALQTLTQAYRASTPQTIPASGWWYNPATPGTYYVVEAENGVVRLGVLSYSAKGDLQWSLVRCGPNADWGVCRDGRAVHGRAALESGYNVANRGHGRSGSNVGLK